MNFPAILKFYSRSSLGGKMVAKNKSFDIYLFCFVSVWIVFLFFLWVNLLHDSGLLFLDQPWPSPSSPARVVFHIPDWLHHFLMTGRILVKNTLEAYTDHYLRYKLNQVVQEHRLVSLITLLRGTKKMLGIKNSSQITTETIKSSCAVPDNVFCESSLPRSQEEKQLRAKRTFEEMMSYIPGMQLAISSPDSCPRSASETSRATHVKL